MYSLSVEIHGTKERNSGGIFVDPKGVAQVSCQVSASGCEAIFEDRAAVSLACCRRTAIFSISHILRKCVLCSSAENWQWRLMSNRRESPRDALIRALVQISNTDVEDVTRRASAPDFRQYPSAVGIMVLLDAESVQLS